MPILNSFADVFFLDTNQRYSQRKIQLFILFLAFVSFLTDFRASVIPCHDARLFLSAFQVYYSGLYHDNDLPLWLPYGRYGSISTVHLMYLTPPGFFIGAIGKLFSVTDVLLLFKISVLFEYLLFIMGLVKLSQLLFVRHESVLFVGIGAIFTFSWMVSLDSNLHTFYMLPLILNYMILFLRTGRMRQFWMVGVYSVFGSIGAAYFPVLLALLLTLFVAAMLAQSALKGMRLSFSWWDLAPFLVFVAGAAAFFEFYVVNFKGMDCFSLGRDPETRRVQKEVFLTWGGVSKLQRLAQEYLFGAHTQGDNTFYLGLAPIYFAVVAFFQSRRKESLAFAILASFIIAFSFGGPTAELTYYFPGMSLYRHVGMVFGIARFLILMTAGFGIDCLLENAYSASPEKSIDGWSFQLSGRTADGKLRIFALAVLGMECVLSVFSNTAPWMYRLFPNVDYSHPPLAFFVLRIAGYAACAAIALLIIKSRPLTKLARCALVAHLALFAFAADVASFRLKGILDWPAASAEEIACCRDIFQPRKVAFSESRTDPGTLLAQEQNRGLRFMVSHGIANQVFNINLWDVVALDPSQPYFRTDFISSFVTELLGSRNIEIRMFPWPGMVSESDRWLANAIALGVPKLRLIPASQLNANFMEPDPPALQDAKEEDIAVLEMKHNSIKIAVRSDSKESQRLYYSDTFNEGWRAFIDGIEAPIARTNIAFKSVLLRPGPQIVEFRFFNGWGSLSLYFIAIGSLALVCFSIVDVMRRGCG